MKIKDLNTGDKFKFKKNSTNVYIFGEVIEKGASYYRAGIKYKTGIKDIVFKSGSMKLIDKEVIKINNND